MSEKPIYRKSLSSARKLGEAFRRVTRPLKGVPGLAERIGQLSLDDLPEDEQRHHTGYVGAILEFAAQHAQGYRTGYVSGSDDEEKNVNRNDLRAFAQHFLSKKPEYSRSKSGLAASQMEAWLVEAGGTLFQQFVETVIEQGTRFLAVFEGKLDMEELRKLRSATGSFMRFETLIKAGETNGGEIFEFTVLDCTAAPTKERDVYPQLKGNDPSVKDKSDDVRFSGMGPVESLLPSNRDEYDRVYEEGGLPREALLAIAGADVFDNCVEVDKKQFVSDPNGVAWTSEDGYTWLPEVDQIDEAGGYEADDDEDEVDDYGYDKPEQEPRNYREAEDSARTCSRCRYYRHEGSDIGYCHLYATPVEPAWTCDSWEARQEGLIESAEDAAVQSDYGAWTVVQEAEQVIVTVGERAWLVPHGYEEVVEGIASIGEMYPELPSERDVMVEAYLRDYAEEAGVPCGRPALTEDVECRTDERDAIVEANNQERLQSRVGDVREEAEEIVRETYPDVAEGSEQWDQLCEGLARSLRRELSERGKVVPALAFPDEEPTTRKGAFKVSSKALSMFREAGILSRPSDAVFKKVLRVVDEIPRNELPKLFGVTSPGAAAIPDAQDVLARQPRRAFQMFLRNVQRVSPRLHKVLQQIGQENASLIFYAITERLSGEDMANIIFRRYFATQSDHHKAVPVRNIESVEEADDDEEGDGKKP
jgi:hypothetical protein